MHVVVNVSVGKEPGSKAFAPAPVAPAVDADDEEGYDAGGG